MINKNYYELLESDPTFTYDKLKENYQKLARKYHPDKSSEDNEENDKFVEIDKAWKTLRDPELRSKYDAEILNDRINKGQIIYARLIKKDLNFINSEAKFDCRCGNSIIILEEYFTEADECQIDCEECSNSILISSE